MFHLKAAAVVVWLAWTTSAAFACDIYQFDAGVRFCQASCFRPHMQRQCEGSGYMATMARHGDANGIREGFERCQFGSDRERGNAQACLRNNPQGMIAVACNVYGGCPPVTPTPTPPPAPVTLPIDLPMRLGPDRRSLVGDITAQGRVTIVSFQLSYMRNGRPLRVVTQRVVSNAGAISTPITLSATLARRFATARFHVKGTLVLQPQP